MSNAQLIHASAHHLPMIETGGVQCIATSPPYWWQRIYGCPTAWPAVEYSPLPNFPAITIEPMVCELGLEPTLEAFIGHLVLCLREWWRVLRKDGVCWVNLGDTYIQHTRFGTDKAGRLYRHRITNALSVNRSFGKASGLKVKNLALVPFRFALAAQAEGWVVRSDVIWSKTNSLPDTALDRPSKTHEYIFLLVKHRRYFYDADAIRKPLAPKTLTTYNTTRRVQPSDGTELVKSERWGAKKRGPRLDANGKPVGANIVSVWSVAPQKHKVRHFAPWPEKLAETMVLAGSRPGDIVLDPFNGSGTTGRVAMRWGRRYIGVDLKQEYLDELTPEHLTTQIALHEIPEEGAA